MRYVLAAISILLMICGYFSFKIPIVLYNGELKSLYLLEVSPKDAAEFSRNASRITGRPVGYILGSSEMVAIVVDGECDGNAELRTYILDYLGSNQFVCYRVFSGE